ncbi:GNAT family N-acetyltransferase [Actinoplanes sp. CA-054009]
MSVLSPARAESAEAEYMFRTLAGAPAADRELLGLAGRRLGGGVALSASRDPIDFLSRALAFTEPVTAELVDEVLAFFRAEGTRSAAFQVVAGALPADWAEIGRARGIERHGPGTMKLGAPIGEVVTTARSDLRVAPVAEDDAERWAGVLVEAFGFPREGYLGLLTVPVREPGFHPFAVWDGDTMVGGASLFVHGDVASFNTGGVLPAHRNRGGQSALLAARAAAARDLGCRWVVAETEAPAAGATNTSLDNLRRAGLKTLYVRPEFVWR